MQNLVIDSDAANSEQSVSLPEHESPPNNLTSRTQVAEANPYTQALSDIAVQLHSLDAAFSELDDLRSEEKGLQEAHDQIVAEEATQ